MVPARGAKVCRGLMSEAFGNSREGARFRHRQNGISAPARAHGLKITKGVAYGCLAPASRVASVAGSECLGCLMRSLLLMVIFTATLASLTEAQHSPDPRVADLVQAGKIRVAVHSVMYTMDSRTGELKAASTGIILLDMRSSRSDIPLFLRCAPYRVHSTQLGFS